MQLLAGSKLLEVDQSQKDGRRVQGQHIRGCGMCDGEIPLFFSWWWPDGISDCWSVTGWTGQASMVSPACNPHPRRIECSSKRHRSSSAWQLGWPWAVQGIRWDKRLVTFRGIDA